MKALLYQGQNKPLSLEELEKPKPAGNEVLVKIEAAALNHRDVWITKGLYPNLREGTILGSDGVGTSNNNTYMINPNQRWGGHEGYPSPDYTIIGMPEHGTFAEYLAIPEDRLTLKPAHLTLEEAAALPVAGLTAYRVLFKKCRVTSSDRVLISGIGGGVALLACQFALAIGAEVWVTSSSDEKIQMALAMGAMGGALYTESTWHKALRQDSKGFDVIVDSAGGDGFAALAALTNPGARIGIYGGTKGKISGLSPQIIFWRQIQILGSTMGSDNDFKEMLGFVTSHQIHPKVDSVHNLVEYQQAFARMSEGKQFGKIVMKV